MASRCAKFRFQSLPVESMRARLAAIGEAEHCPLNAAQLDTILTLAEGDMRRAVQTLQSVHALGQQQSMTLDDAAIRRRLLGRLFGPDLAGMLVGAICDLATTG